jgi:hypothetical protein
MVQELPPVEGQYQPEDEESQGDRLARLIADKLGAIERALKATSPNFPHRDRLMDLVEQFKSLQ